MLRELIRLAINQFGYDVHRVNRPGQLHVVDSETDPITFEYLPHRRGHAVFEIALNDVSSFHALALPLRPECNPFVRAIRAASDQQDDDAMRCSIAEVLESYYDAVRPTSAADVLGLSLEEAPGLHDVPPSAYLMPWWAQTLEEVRAGHRKSAFFEGLQNGVVASVGDGMTAFGPVNSSKMELEVSRLFRLLKSVLARGLDPFNPRSPVKVAALRHGDQYTWMVESGQHRLSTAAALGIKSVPAVVRTVVRREDAAYWPHVANGVVTRAGAEKLFDRIFTHVPAPICRPWIDIAHTEQERLRA